MDEGVQHVFIVGAKSMGAYGGFETFVDRLTEHHQHDPRLQYHVACKASGPGSMDETALQGAQWISDTEFVLHGARCFRIPIPEIGSAQAIYYDVAALREVCRYIRNNNVPHPIVYILACRIGPFMSGFRRRIHRLGGRIFLNPDGHEWKRAKWSRPVQRYWKFSERLMVRDCDLCICDSRHIEQYIHEQYDGKTRGGCSPRTVYAAYGTDPEPSQLTDDDPALLAWYREKGLTPKDYYLVVGRFVPENSYETMIREFMKSRTRRSFALITGVNERFLEELEEKLHFRSDERIRFVGTVYDPELLKKIRENAYAYFHGHTVGGTNPSLIEALGSTDLNLLIDVPFNEEVAGEGALYWTREEGSLSRLINEADAMPPDQIHELGSRAKRRVAERYTWERVAQQYARIFLQGGT